MALMRVLWRTINDLLDRCCQRPLGESITLNEIVCESALPCRPWTTEGDPHRIPPSERNPPQNSPPRRFVAPQLHPGLQRPARQRAQDTHGQAALCRHADCGPAAADEGDYDFGAAKSLTRPTTPSTLSRSSV